MAKREYKGGGAYWMHSKYRIRDASDPDFPGKWLYGLDNLAEVREAISEMVDAEIIEVHKRNSYTDDYEPYDSYTQGLK